MIWARERLRGVWHIAIETYPSQADTVCGERIEADLFMTGSPTAPGSATAERRELCESCKARHP